MLHEKSTRILKSRTLAITTVILSAGLWAGFCNRAYAAGASTARQLRALEARLDELAGRNAELRAKLQAQQSEIDGLKAQLESTAQQAAPASKALPELKQEVAALQTEEHKRSVNLPFGVGFRVGWAENPYDMPGGVMYGAYMTNRLLDEEDGVPYGEISGELMAAVILGRGAKTPNNLATLLGVVGPAKTWITDFELEPTVQYYLDLASLGMERWRGLKPYVLAGPAIYMPMMSTPVVSPFKAPGAGFRHNDYVVDPGAVYGLGLSFHAGDLLWVPAIQRILDKVRLGAEWRYNWFGNGQQWQQYSGTIGFGF